MFGGLVSLSFSTRTFDFYPCFALLTPLSSKNEVLAVGCGLQVKIGGK
jgi:hypothetical protein